LIALRVQRDHPRRVAARTPARPKGWQETAALRDFDPVYIRFGSGADIACLLSNGRFTPESGHHELALPCPLSAKSGCEQSQQGRRYSITSSAATSSPGGTVRPSARSETGRQISC